jgi:hypothetical protein
VKKLKKLLLDEKAAITKMWLDKLFQTYSPDAVKLFAKDKNQFTNPVGNILSEGINGAFEALVEEDNEALAANLDKIIRIRSVQDMSASQSVSFVFFLKDVVRRALKNHLKGPAMMAELIRFDAGVDAATLAAFDAYVQCRDKVFELRVNEVKRNVSQILKMTGFFENDPDSHPDQKPGRM